MRPNFTLSLSFDGIALLHRAAGGWRMVGEVPLTADGLKSELAMLRKTAAALEPGGVRCKLLIPNDQIRYLTIETPDMDAAARRDAAIEALDGATPYAVDDLAFDISPDGARTHIAAVACETLEEAEGFAHEHRFHPVSFVAAPGDQPFLGEPYFGPSRHTSTLLEPGETVEPDGVAVVVIGEIDTSVREGKPKAAAPQSDLNDPLAKALAMKTDAARDQTPPLAGVSAPNVPSLEPPVPGFSSRRTAPDLEGADRMGAPGFAEEAADELTPPKRRFQIGTPATAPAPIPPAPSVPQAAPDTRVNTDPPDSEARKFAIYGTRDTQDVGGKPRFLGLILTAVLLVLLTVIAAWATLFLDDGVAGLFSDPDERTASVPAPQDAPEPQAQAAFVDPSLTDEDAAVLDALRRPEPEAQPVLDLSDDALAARYAVTGIWPLAPDVPSPPQLVSLDDLYVTSIDPINLVFDAVALPDAALPRADVTLGEIRSPMSADVRFDLDADGLVRPTPDGALSPDGVRVFAGQPPRVPPQTLRRTEPQAALPEAVDPQLAGFRPRTRPAGLAESNERATLGGLTRDELADYKPRLRPTSVQEAALASASLVPQDGGTLGTDQDTADAEDALAEDIANAVAASIRPDARPSNFATIVERATQAPEQETRTAAVAPQTVAPRIPSSASVSRSATVPNAINLRRVNLIGVYGKPSDRRALVRLPNGRYQKVQVGDRIDGGRVSAIGDAELRYQKSGRNVVLKMPDS